MIVDLAKQTETNVNLVADVMIAGAGIAGLNLATQLRSSGFHVVVLESGDREQTADTHPLNRVIQLGDAYSGASRGRFRCLGGTSTRWGGALIPFIEHDTVERPYLNVPRFPIDISSVTKYLPQIEELYGIANGSYEEDFVREINAEKYIPIGDPDFKVRFAKWPAFKIRNMATLFREPIHKDPDLEVWLNATVTNFLVDRQRGRLQSVTGRHESGRSVVVAAKHFVICAGAIESTRLLLLLDREYDGRIFDDCEALGHFFYDHISVPMAEIKATQVKRLNRMAGFRFTGSAMRSLRFELSASVQEKECVGSAFGHISFRALRSGGFEAVRQLLRSQQQNGKINPELVMAVLHDAPYLVKLGVWRLLYKQLLWPVPAIYELHVVAEQLPRADNYISLSSETDPFELPLAAINWRVAERDCSTFNVFKRSFGAFWLKHRLDSIGELNWLDSSNSDLRQRMRNADVYHPGGSTRMGIDRRTAVVDPELQTFSIDNLSVASTSTFPVGGGANPTLMLMLFTMRLADRLANRLKNH